MHEWLNSRTWLQSSMREPWIRSSRKCSKPAQMLQEMIRAKVIYYVSSWTYVVCQATAWMMICYGWLAQGNGGTGAIAKEHDAQLESSHKGYNSCHEKDTNSSNSWFIITDNLNNKHMCGQDCSSGDQVWAFVVPSDAGVCHRQQVTCTNAPIPPILCKSICVSCERRKGLEVQLGFKQHLCNMLLFQQNDRMTKWIKVC